MKTMKKIIWILVLSTPLLISSQAKAYGGKHPREGDNDGHNKAPINGGIALLVAAGVGFGIMKMRNNRAGKMATDSSI